MSGWRSFRQEYWQRGHDAGGASTLRRFHFDIYMYWYLHVYKPIQCLLHLPCLLTYCCSFIMINNLIFFSISRRFCILDVRIPTNKPRCSKHKTVALPRPGRDPGTSGIIKYTPLTTRPIAQLEMWWQSFKDGSNAKWLIIPTDSYDSMRNYLNRLRQQSPLHVTH